MGNELLFPFILVGIDRIGIDRYPIAMDKKGLSAPGARASGLSHNESAKR